MAVGKVEIETEKTEKTEKTVKTERERERERLSGCRNSVMRVIIAPTLSINVVCIPQKCVCVCVVVFEGSWSREF